MIFLLIKNIHCNTIFWLTRDIGLNMVKAAMDLTLAINLKQLLRPMKTFIMEVLNLKLVVRPSMVKMDMKWPNGDMGVTNMGRFIFMLIKNRSYQVRFNKSFFLSKNNHNFNILIDTVINPICFCTYFWMECFFLKKNFILQTRQLIVCSM